MPTLMTKDDVMRMAVNLGRAAEVWSDVFDTVSGNIDFQLPQGGRYQVVVLKIEPTPAIPARRGRIRIGTMKDKWRIPTIEEDKAMDEEIAASMKLDEDFT
jgi:hypothetical protein